MKAELEQKQLVKTARLAGIWYLLLAISGVVGFLVLHPRVFVGADPEKTMNNLMDGSAARLRLLFELIIVVSQALAAVWFYKLFNNINRWAASTLGIWGTINSMIILVSAIAMSSAIEVANSSSLNFQEKVPLIQLLTSIITNAWSVGGLFFGLWLIPMGYIASSSGRMPVWLGRTLIIGGIGYLLQTFLIAIGIKSSLLNFIVLPATVGEFWMIGYLLSFGIRPDIDSERQTD